MKTRHKLSRVLTAAVALAVVSGAAWASPDQCGRIGTWFGSAGSPTPILTWFGVDTEGKNDKNGEMILDWVFVDPTWGNPNFSLATRLTGGRGVWEKIHKNEYKYTWYAYGIMNNGFPLYSIRVSGFVSQADCDQAGIDYTVEFFVPPVAPQNMSMPGVTPVGVHTGTATETRVPLVVTP